MRIFFLFHGRYPSEKAAAIFQHEEACALADLGYAVTVVAPRRFGRGDTSFFSDGEKMKYRRAYMPTIDLVPLGIWQGLAFRLSLLCYSWSALVYLWFHAKRDDLVISNEPFPLLVASFFFPRTLFELHDYPEQSLWMYRALFARARHILVTNRWKFERLAKDFPGVAKKAFVEENAVDVAQFSSTLSRGEARDRLALPRDAKIALYTGHLYSWKGVDTLAEAARIAGDIEVYVVGGTESDVAAFRAKWGGVENVHIVGRKSHGEIPLWQRAADVLVLPNTAREEISSHYTSPMKLFEYMASGTPIVAPDLPSIREIVGDDRALLMAPDDPAALARGLKNIIENSSAAEARAGAARTLVAEHSWSKRAGRMLGVFT